MFPERNAKGGIMNNNKRERYFVSIIQQKIQRRHNKKINKRIKKYHSQRHINDNENRSKISRITLTKIGEENDNKDVLVKDCNDSCSSTCDVTSDIPFEICYYNKDDDDDSIDSLMSFLSQNPQQAKSLFTGCLIDDDVTNDNNSNVIVLLNKDDNNDNNNILNISVDDEDHVWSGRIVVDESSAEMITEYRQQIDTTPIKDNRSIKQTNTIASNENYNNVIQLNSLPKTEETATTTRKQSFFRLYPRIIHLLSILTNVCAITILLLVICGLYHQSNQCHFFPPFDTSTTSSVHSFSSSKINHYFFLFNNIILNKKNILDNIYLE